jgi:hypothetical protein
MLNPVMHPTNEIFIIPEKFILLSFTVSEKMEKQFFDIKTPYLMTGCDFVKFI